MHLINRFALALSAVLVASAWSLPAAAGPMLEDPAGEWTGKPAVVASAPLEAGVQAGFEGLRGSGDHHEGRIRIAYVPIAPEFTYYRTMEAGVIEAASAADVDVLTAGPPGSGDNQEHVEILEQIIAMPDVHGLIVAVRDAELAAPVLRRAVEAGIVVVITNSDLRAFPTAVHAVVGYSQRGANRAMGAHVAKLLGDASAEVALIEGAPGYHSTEAVAGFREGLRAAAGARVVGSRSGGWSIDGGRDAAQALLAEHPNLAVIWAANDNMIMGALQAAEAAGRSELMLLGRDGDPDAIELIRERRLTATADTDPAAMGATSVAVIVEALAGRFHGGFVETPTHIIQASTE